MGDQYPKFRAAAVAASPVFLDREATTAKAARLIAEAAGQGAGLVAFPEAFVPGYPYWIWLGTPTWGAPFFAELYKNAVEIPSATTDTLCQAARAANANVVIGINERAAGTLYNTLLFIARDGEILGRHRKLQPTHVERTIWGRGDGSDLQVFRTDVGAVGGLICWEHTMDLVRYALIALGEEVHVAAWPGISAVTHNPHACIFNDITESAARHHALAGQVFVINVQSPIDQETIDRFGLAGQDELIRPGGGWTAIIAPDGRIIGGPLTDGEGIVYADIDLEERIMMKYACDSIGHYARPDVVRLVVDLAAQPVVEYVDLSAPKPPAGPALAE
ncbi:MAG: carbon-nitrogen hydrolase family protein [Gammaproteobacteria bacterium]|nr:carbon-nitrogen hydrolase family protein [Gammaproteobacteria bacterium]